MIATILGFTWIALPDKTDFTWTPPSRGVVQASLDVNYRGSNHVWDGEWTVGRFSAAPQGSKWLRLLSGSSEIRRGDYVVLVDPTMGQDRAEFSRIESVDGERAFLDQPLADTFAGGHIVKVPSERVARNITIDGWQVDTDGENVGIWAMFVDGITVKNTSAGNAPGSAIRFDFCRNIRIEDSAVWDRSKRGGHGRGFDFYNCRGLEMTGTAANGLRHAYHFTNTRDFRLSRLASASSQDASLDFHGRNSGNGVVKDSLLDGTVKIGNPSFIRGDRGIQLDNVRTETWFQVHGGSEVSMVGCRGQNLLATGYAENAWPTITASQSQFVLKGGPWLHQQPQVCFNVNGPWPQVQATFEDCVFRSEITGRWTREIFLEGVKSGSRIELRSSKAERVQVTGFDPIVKR
ncbi:MAG: hypothetical protein HONBIEJF_01761 [Fimbriimonadaceae bacterium]|nr:hypothetical protein [Fimbriimonadaceae bacterium]